MAEGFLTQSKYAAYRGVSRKAVTTWKQKGLLVLTPEGKVDVEASDQLLPRDGEWRKVVTPGNSTSTDSLVRRVLAEEGEDIGDAGLTLTHVRMAVGILKAREQSIANDVARNALITIEEVGTVVEGEYAVVRANLQSMPGEIAGDCEGLDAAAIEEILATKINEILTALSADEGYLSKEAA